MVYNYQTQQDEPLKEGSMMPVILSFLLTVAIILWVANIEDRDLSIARDLEDVLNDHECAGQLSNYHITHPFEIVHEVLLGDFPQGSLKAGKLINSKNRDVYLVAIANDNYKTTDTRQKFKTPIISISFEPAHVEDAVRLLKPSMRATEEQRLTQAFRTLKGKPKEQRQLWEQQARTKVDEDEEGEQIEE